MHFTMHLIEISCAIYVANTVKGMNIEGLFGSHEYPTETFKRHMESKKHSNAKKEKTRNQKSIGQREDIQANDRWRKIKIQKCQKEKPPYNNKEIP